MAYNVLIIGVGLIGGSLGLALQESPRVASITGYDTHEDTLIRALEMGAIDARTPLKEAVPVADIIFLCTSPALYEDIIAEISPWLTPGTLITDVGSTKMPVTELFSRLPAAVCGIGGHPMAGSETKGIQGADRYLFENAAYILTPLPHTPEETLGKLVGLLQVTGARIRIMPAGLHDRLAATVSHVPHLCAVALVNTTGGDPDTMMMAAGGFRDTTRIASSNPGLWEDILFSNRDEILAGLDRLVDEIQILKNALRNDQHELMAQKLKQARETRDSIPRLHRGFIPAFCDIICIVPDRPGIIGHLGKILGDQGINIVDIEILRVREGDGGTIRLGVPTGEDALLAVEILDSKGIKAWTR